MVSRVSTPSARRRLQTSRVFGSLLVGIGLVGSSYLIGRQRSGETPLERPRAYVPEFKVVEVPVPDRPVGAGISIREVPVRFEKFPEHQLPSGVVRDIGRVRDSVTLVALPGGLPILDVNLGTGEESSNPLVGRIPQGMRAMTVRVDVTAAVEGWARTGSIVDVLLVEKQGTRVVAERVKIISTERSLSATASLEPAGTVPSTVTLLVTQEQCLAINTAVAVGKIAFALRGGADGESWRDGDFEASDLSDREGKKRKPKIEGVVSVGVGDRQKRYALVDGRWIPAESMPAGFFSHHERNEGGGK
ncbi:MAG: Flp pilus assembly protein CpaB [Pseudomonadota bacterium]